MHRDEMGGEISVALPGFGNLIVDHLTEHGVMELARLYESPFTDINPRGPSRVEPCARRYHA